MLIKISEKENRIEVIVTENNTPVDREEPD